MTSRIVFPDVLKDLKEWLKAHPLLLPLIERRVFFRIPPHPTGSPLIRIYRSGGAVQANSEVPIQDIRIGVEAWSLIKTEYEPVRKTAAALESAFYAVTSPTPLNGPTGTIVSNASHLTSVDLPDPDTGLPRIHLDVVLTVQLGGLVVAP